MYLLNFPLTFPKSLIVWGLLGGLWGELEVMYEYIPHPKLDRLLKGDEAIRAVMGEKYDEAVKEALIYAVRAGEVNVWLCWDGKLRYQYVGGPAIT
jgi:hypothetical protein